MTIAINSDHTISLDSERKNCKSLFNIMAQGNVEYANVLDADELWAVLASVKVAPFPLGNGEAIYRQILNKIKKDPQTVFTSGAPPELSLGKLRKAIVFQAGDGCNAPTDSYLRIAKQIKLREPVRSY